MFADVSREACAVALLGAFHHPLVGMVVLGLGSLTLTLAWHYHTSGRVRRAVLLVVATGGVLRLYAGSDLYLHTWDETFHALVARNLLLHPLTPTLYDNPVMPYDYTNWSANHVWVHKPPLTLWLMALSLWVGGATELAVRLPSIILSSLATVAIYGVGRCLTEPRVAFLASILWCTNGDLLDLVGGRAPVDHVDSLMVTLVVVGIWLAGCHVTRRTRWALVGLGCCTGLALLTKWLVALLIPGVWLVWAAKRLRPLPLVTSLVVVLLLAGLIALPWQLSIAARFPREAAWEQTYNVRHMTEMIEGHREPWFYYLRRLGHPIGPLVYVPIVWFLTQLLCYPVTPEQIALAAWAFVPYVVFSCMATKMPNYVLTALPALLLIVASFWFWLAAWCTRDGLSPRWLRRLGRLYLIALLGFAIEHGVECLARLPFPVSTRHPGWAAQLRQLRGQLPLGQVILFNSPHPIQAMFYTGVPVYASLPSAETVERLQQEGYQLVCLDPGGLPDYIQKNPAILVIAQQTETTEPPLLR